ncbi:MAG TPA: MraY family glycosyltransferase [Acidobacteriota bacterium]|nr:MraY family glycosyltransferase [Acidobacteriota bacterium]
MFNHLLVFLIAAAVAFLLTAVVRKIAFKLDFLDQPDPRKIHRTPTPLLGGLSLFAASLVAVSWSFDRVIGHDPRALREVIGILSGGFLLLIVGLLDDRGRLHSQFKLVVAMPLSALFLVLGGLRVSTWPGVSLFQNSVQLYELTSLLLTIAWVVGFTAAFSIFDHMDGLSSGVAAIAAAFFLLFATLNGQYLVGTLSAAILGASLGFLVWNFNPARIFMGDAGAMFLGFMMATLAMKLDFLHIAGRPSWLIPILILGIPLLDACLVSISRLRRGLNPLKSPGKDHTAHRLVRLGFHPRAAVMLMYFAAIVLGATSVAFYQWSFQTNYLVLLGLAVAAAIAILLLELAPCDESDDSRMLIRR